MAHSNFTRRQALALAGTGLLAACAAPATSPQGTAETSSEQSIQTPSTPSEGISVEALDKSATSSWDAQYYKPAYATKEEAKAAAEKIALEIEREGIVLLKNEGVLPLLPGTSVSLLGRGAHDTVFGGTGAAAIDEGASVSLAEGLKEAGLALNEAALEWIRGAYADIPRATVGRLDRPDTVSHYIGEIPWEDYPQDVVASLADTVGIVVLSRPSGEGDDLSRDLLGDLERGKSGTFTPNRETANYVAGQHQLELSAEELSMLAGAKAACSQVVVLLNVATTLEAGPLVEKGGAHEADALLEIGFPGGVGALAVGEVLTGRENPSGRTCDTWAADFTHTPSFANFGDQRYTDVDGYYTQLGSGACFVEYTEGIYIGYRWFETAAHEGAIDYASEVVFPFGYGLSYTSFTQTLDGVSADADHVRATVTVTNTGDFAGKDVVQLYFSAPWAPGMAEKSSVVLGAFAKTRMLSAEESQTLELEWDTRDMASYDPAIAGWMLERGTYEVSLRANAHDVIAAETFYLEERAYTEDSATGAAVQNRFEDTDAYLDANCTRLSRADFAGTRSAKAADKSAASVGVELSMYDALAARNDADEMPVLGADPILSTIDLRGRAFDDPAWERLLDQLEPADMERICSENIYGTPYVRSVGKPVASDADGPAGIAYYLEPTGHCAFPSEYTVAQGWNVELAHAMGEALGEEALVSGISGWCAPALNMHRSPFGGRSFEYYSEDPLLAGALGCAAVEGAFSRGVYSQMKHFCLNDQDSCRCWHLLTWAGEQTIREIYARPFEIVVKRAKGLLPYLDAATGERKERQMSAATAVMSSYNYVGATWAGGRESLVTGLLRDEWGFEGYVVSDWSFYDYMEKNQAVYAGTDVNFTSVEETGPMVDTQSATALLAMRRAMHRYLYTLANSNAVNGVAPKARIIDPV